MKNLEKQQKRQTKEREKGGGNEKRKRKERERGIIERKKGHIEKRELGQRKEKEEKKRCFSCACKNKVGFSLHIVFVWVVAIDNFYSCWMGSEYLKR